MVILNIGCGNDFFGDVRLDFHRTASTNVVGDAHVLPFRDEVFDIVHERNLLEHLSNVGQHLREVKRVLKTRGTLDLITDNAESPHHYVLGTHTGCYRKSQGKDIHYGIFTAEHLKNFMRLVGLKLESLNLVETTYFTKWFDRIIGLIDKRMRFARIHLMARKVDNL